MDLSALRIFRAVVREGGVTRAAASLHRVQSNVTTRIRQLEASLGTALFIRDGRRLVLTPAGEALLPYAERLLALAEEARHMLGRSQPQGRLRLGAMESTAASRLPRALASYHQRWPQVALELSTAVTQTLIDRVRQFDIDAAIVARPLQPDMLPDDQFEVVPVFTEQLLLLTPRGLRPPFGSGSMAGQTLLAFEPGCVYRDIAIDWFSRQGFQPARVLEMASYHAMIACVAAGAGLAVVPYSVLTLTGLDHELDQHPLGESASVDSLLIWRRGHLSAALQALREQLLGEASSFPAG